jgi:hypothetical protein
MAVHPSRCQVTTLWSSGWVPAGNRNRARSVSHPSWRPEPRRRALRRRGRPPGSAQRWHVRHLRECEGRRRRALQPSPLEVGGEGSRTRVGSASSTRRCPYFQLAKRMEKPNRSAMSPAGRCGRACPPPDRRARTSTGGAVARRPCSLGHQTNRRHATYRRPPVRRAYSETECSGELTTWRMRRRTARCRASSWPRSADSRINRLT